MKFSTTKILIEVEATTQFGPKAAVHLLKNLLRVPAILSTEIKSVESNYRLHKDPSKQMQTVSFEEI